MKCGAVIETFDGAGGVSQWEVSELSKKAAHLNRTGSIQVQRKNPVSLKLGLNPLKGGNELDAIRIAAAMEVVELIPVFFRRTDVPFDEKHEKRLDRWFRACVSETEQSGGAFLPEIAQPITLEALISREKVRTLVFYENAEPKQDDPKFKRDEEILALIGPEGGIDEGEAEFARENGCEVVSLGDWTLRAQYAASQVPLWVYSRVN